MPEMGAGKGAGDRRELRIGDVVWSAEVTGAAAVGGSSGPVIECVHFRRPDDPAIPILRTYLPRGRFPELGDAELLELHREASPIQPRAPHEAAPDPEAPPGRERAVVEYPEPDDA